MRQVAPISRFLGIGVKPSQPPGFRSSEARGVARRDPQPYVGSGSNSAARIGTPAAA